MKGLEKRIAAHARAHITILKARRVETDLSEPQAQLIINRIEHMLEQLPAAVKQAHERIIGNVWGDRGLASKPNTALLEKRGIGNGPCPRNVCELADKLTNQQGFREGLKRRASTEGRIGIFKNVFLGRQLLAKGFEHRQLAVGWAFFTHNFWVVVRMAEAEKKRKEDQQQKVGIAST